MAALREDPLDLALERAVELARVVGRFDELVGLPPPLELGAGEEVVIHSVPLSRPLRPRGGRYRVAQVVAGLQQHLRDGRLPAAGGCGEHEQETASLEVLELFPEFLQLALHRDDRCAMAASPALAPMVFTSRPSSCARNPSCFPTGPSAASASRAAADMGAEPHQLLGDVELVGQKRELLRQPCLVHRPAVEQLATAALSRSRSRTSRSGARRQSPWPTVPAGQPVPQLGGQRLSLAGPHGPAFGSRPGATTRLDLAPGDLAGAVGVPEPNTSGCRATSSIVTSPPRPSVACSSRSRAATAGPGRDRLRIRSRHRRSRSSAPGPTTCPRSKSRRSRSRSSPSNGLRSPGSLAERLK